MILLRGLFYFDAYVKRIREDMCIKLDVCI